MIRTEEIYDAATDDAVFDGLASRLAIALQARSAVLHWGHSANGVEEISYSGYFSDPQMINYDLHFQDEDLWADAMDLPASANRAWNCEELVPTSTYEQSRIYNEWIRPMGDDTFHCLGGVIRHREVHGKIGLHRGRTQKSFTSAEVRSLQDCIGHIGKMVSIRSKLDRARHHGRTLHATLDLVAHAIFILRPSGDLMDCNRAAEAMLRRSDALTLRQNQVKARTVADDEALQAALRVAAAPEATLASAIFVHGEGRLPYALSIASLSIDGQRQIILIAQDPEAEHDGSLISRIRGLFGLTRAEAEVAEALSRGKALEQLSQERGVALNTVRTQMKNIYAKLDCSRQSELVARINQLPRLGMFRDAEDAES